MTDETRKALIAYMGHDVQFCLLFQRNLLLPGEAETLAAAAVRKAIIEKGEWMKFEEYAHQKHREWLAGSPPFEAYKSFTQWLTDAETFLRVAGEFVEGRK